MRERFFLFAGVIFLITVIIGLNAATFTQRDTLPDSEFYPKRSTYNAGATGTRALYEFLAETGKNVSRRQSSFITLADEANQPDTLVIIGNAVLPINDKEAESLFRWISNGGKLVLIDRNPSLELLKTTANWRIDVAKANDSTFNIDPSDQRQMTDKTAAAKPLQPSILNQNITSVQPSRFASTPVLEYFGDDEPPLSKPTSGKDKSDENEPPPPPKVVITNKTVKDTAIGSDEIVEDEIDYNQSNSLDAPFVHLENNNKRILIDFPFGEGKIIWLTDPYIVSNAGIGIVDNLQIALNIIGSDGVIAFDEYHHGYGEGQSRLFAYFSDTPVFPIIGQLALLIFLLLVSQSRRFARPLPEVVPSRISKLEYVSAFAELQKRTKAYDLAIENIYTDFRRKAARLFGADNFTITRQELAEKIAERSKFNHLEIYNLLKRCEEIIQGDATNKKEILRLTVRIRELEEALNIKRTKKNF